MKGFDGLMPQRLTALKRWTVLAPFFAPLAGFLALGLGGGLGGLLLAASLSAADPASGRIPFQIATGETSGAYFSVGQAIAGLISHPQGVDRCNIPTVCGPPGLIITARTSPGTIQNVIAVNNGSAESGLARADLVAAAMRGDAPFRAKATHVRVIASLFSEDVHLLVAANSKIKSVADLKGKRIWMGGPGAGISFTAREILKAYRVPAANLKIVSLDTFAAFQQLETGKLDALFTVGGVPQEQVTNAFGSGRIRLLPIDGPARDRLVQEAPMLAEAVIPAGAYPGQGATQTVSTEALWIVRDSVPAALVYGITKALFDPANHDGLAAGHPAAREIGLAMAARNLPAALHPGAARFYSEMKAPHS
jgi:uncharacterized protein